MDYVLGIDGGGSGCRAALATLSGIIVGRAESGAANIRTDLAGARANIIEAARLAFLDAGADPACIPRTPALLGLAGANVGNYGRQLAADLPFRLSRVETDAEIALEGAIGAGDGAMAILGTGTAYMARRNGASRAIGGWGFQIGDQGSGARIGRDLLEQTLLAHDGVREASQLTDETIGRFGRDPQEVVEFTVHARPGDFACLAPKVFEHAAKGDAVAAAIVDKAVSDVEAALGALGLRDAEPLCLLGGLARLYAPLLAARFRARLKAPADDALGGAVRMAMRLFATRPDAADQQGQCRA